MTYMYENMSDEEYIEKYDSIKYRQEENRFLMEAKLIMMEYAVRMSDIETKAYFENFSEYKEDALYDGAYRIYVEETKSWWQRFKEFVTSLWNKLLGKDEDSAKSKLKKAADDIKDAKDEVDDDGIEVSCDVRMIPPFIRRAGDALKRIVTFRNKDGSFNAGELVGAAAGAGAGAVITMAMNGGFETDFSKFKKKVRIKPDELYGLVDDLVDSAGEFKNAVNDVSEDIPEATTVVEKLHSSVQSLFNMAMNAITSVSSKFKKKPEESNDSNKEEETKKETPKIEDKKDDKKEDKVEEHVKTIDDIMSGFGEFKESYLDDILGVLDGGDM